MFAYSERRRSWSSLLSSNRLPIDYQWKRISFLLLSTLPENSIWIFPGRVAGKYWAHFKIKEWRLPRRKWDRRRVHQVVGTIKWDLRWMQCRLGACKTCLWCWSRRFRIVYVSLILGVSMLKWVGWLPRCSLKIATPTFVSVLNGTPFLLTTLTIIYRTLRRM